MKTIVTRKRAGNKEKITVETELGTFTRTTARDYRFIVAVEPENETGEWGELQWSSRRDLAIKAKATFSKWPIFRDRAIIIIDLETE